MEIAKVTNENLMAGLLLRYRRFSDIDLDVYREILLEKYGYRLSPFALDIKGIINCIMQLGNTYYMIDNPEYSEVLRDKQGEGISNILEQIEIEEVVLRKVEKLGSIPDYVIPSVFNDVEEKVIDSLILDMSLIYVWSSEEGKEEVMELQITSIGKERLNTIKEEDKKKKIKRK